MKTKGEAVPLKEHMIKNFEPPAGKAEASIFDANTNLVLRANRSTRVAADGTVKITRHWLHRHYVDGKRRFAPLGTYPEMSITAAREASKNWIMPTAASNTFAKTAKGFAAMTFGEVIDKFLQKNRKASTINNYTVIADIYLQGKELRSRMAVDIEPSDAWEIIETALTKKMIRDKETRQIIGMVTKEEQTPGGAEKLNALCSAAFSVAISLERTAYVNPFKHIRSFDEFKSEITNRQKADGRTLTPTEIKTIWRNLNSPNGHGSPATARALLLMLITGQRPSEVLTMHENEILEPDDNKDIWWRIPPEKIKTNKATERNKWRPHFVYLSPLALRVIGKYDGKGDIFAGASDEGLTDLHSLNHLIKRPRNQKEASSKSMYLGANDPWSPNDLRRTVQTTLEVSLDCPEKYTAAILNHDKRTKVQKSYTVHNNYPEKKREWLQRWSDWLEATIGPEFTAKIRHEDPSKYDIDVLKRSVWMLPKNKIAKLLNCSDRTVGVLCKKHGIICPPRGYRFPDDSANSPNQLNNR